MGVFYGERMKARGSYAKGIAKRDEILTTALEVIAELGYRKTSIRELAAAVGLSQTGLLHYFGTKEDLFIEVLRRRDEVDIASTGVELAGPVTGSVIIDTLVRIVEHNTEVPGLVHLYTQFSAEAADPNHPAHEYFQQRAQYFRDTVAGAVRDQQVAGELPASLSPERIAALLMAAIDGLQVQWLLDNTVDMVDHLNHLWGCLIRE